MTITSTQLLTLALRALNEIPLKPYIPGLPGYPAPFDDVFDTYKLAGEIQNYLVDDRGFTVILGYDGTDGQTYSGESSADTWEGAVVEVAMQMRELGVDEFDELTIVDVIVGRSGHGTAEGVDRDAVVRFGKGGARVLDFAEAAAEELDPRINTRPAYDAGWFLSTRGLIKRVTILPSFATDAEAVAWVWAKARGSHKNHPYYLKAWEIHEKAMATRGEEL